VLYVDVNNDNIIAPIVRCFEIRPYHGMVFVCIFIVCVHCIRRSTYVCVMVVYVLIFVSRVKAVEVKKRAVHIFLRFHYYYYLRQKKKKKAVHDFVFLPS